MKRLQICKKKTFLICLFIEVLLLVSCVAVLLCRKEKVYTYEPSFFTRSGDGNLVSGEILLPRGIYRVALTYTCDGNMQDFCTVTEPAAQGNLLCSGEHLSGGRGYTDFDMWVKAADTTAVVQIAQGSDNLQITGLSVHQTNRDIARSIFLLLLFAVCLDSLLIWREYDRQSGESEELKREKRFIAAGLLFTIAASSVPVLVNYAYPGSDVTYHLLRIGMLKDGLLSGQFPVRIDPSWIWGHGYANSVCYGETLFYIPAFLRLLGFTLQSSYLMFLFVLNAATCLVSYYSFKTIWKDRWMGLFCSMLYTLSIYRLYKMYSWGALGEAQSMVFLPLILSAVYGIFTEDTKEAGYHKKWLPLAVGFSGIIQCHVLTCELTVLFLAAACIILWKRLFRKETLLVFVKGVLATCALSAWFLIPFLDYYLNVDMVIHHVSARTIQEAGLYPANLLFAFFHRGTTRNLAETGMRNMEALGVGVTMTAAAILMSGLWLFGYLRRQTMEKDCAETCRNMEKSCDATCRNTETDCTVTGQDREKDCAETCRNMEKSCDATCRNTETDCAVTGQNSGRGLAAAGRLALIFGLLAMVMSLAVFPWTKLQFLNIVTEKLISSIQYPNRFLMIATVLLTFVAGVNLSVIKGSWGKRASAFTGIVFGIMATVTSFFYISSIVSDAGALYLYDEKGMGTGYLSGAEYLLYGADQSQFSFHDAVQGEGVEVTAYEKKWLTVTMTVQNEGGMESYVELPLQNYKGYVAKAADTGERLAITDGTNFDIRVTVPEGFVGEITVRFVSPWYWRLAEVVSLLALVLFIVFGVKTCGQRRGYKQAG